MPFLQSDEDELKKQQEANQNLSGQSSIINSPNASQSKPGTPKQSGSWVNLNKYLDANKEGAAQMGQTITGNVDKNAQDTTNKINSFKSASPAATQKLTKDDVYNFYDNANTTDKTQYNNLKTTGGYSGPDSFDKVNGFQEANSSWNKSNEQVKQLGTEEGRQNLLADTYKRPNYSQGQKVFDNLLIQNDSNAKKMFEDTGSKWANLNSMLDSATTDVGNRINTNKQNAFENRKLISGDGVSQGLESQYMDEFLNPIKQRATQANDPNTGNAVKNNAYLSDITDTNLDSATLEALGLKANENTYGLNLGDYFTYDNSNLTEDNIATQGERAKYAALQALMDKSDNLISSTDKSIKPFNFDLEKFRADQTTKRNELIPAGPGYMTAIPERQDVRGLNAVAGTGKIQDWLDSGMSPEEWVDTQLAQNYKPFVNQYGQTVAPDTSWAKMNAMMDIENYIKNYGTILRNK